ncbi:MAG: hypothetical protein F4Y14_08720 [Acidobacteria bacterium]|nr:hypothetical protein [Acidobacteriota bacterium]
MTQHDNDIVENRPDLASPVLDPRVLTFSQAQGLEGLPQPLALGEVTDDARNRIWAVFWDITVFFGGHGRVPRPWKPVLRDVHVKLFVRPADEFESDAMPIRDLYKPMILQSLPYNRLFDLLQHMMRHPECPPQFIDDMRAVFSEARLAYTVNTQGPPTILPAATPEEGAALQNALVRLSEAGFSGAREHLRKAGELINGGDWQGSIRESIHAVESVARRLDAKGAKTLGPAIDRLKREHGIHPALAEACKKLYGYTSDEDGIRHAALDGDAPVDQAEAVFLLGACASFVSYLIQKRPSE